MTALNNPPHAIDQDGDALTEMQDLIGAYDGQINHLLRKMKEAPAAVTHADVIRIPHLVRQRQSTYERISSLTEEPPRAA